MVTAGGWAGPCRDDLPRLPSLWVFPGPCQSKVTEQGQEKTARMDRLSTRARTPGPHSPFLPSTRAVQAQEGQ